MRIVLLSDDTARWVATRRRLEDEGHLVDHRDADYYANMGGHLVCTFFERIETGELERTHFIKLDHVNQERFDADWWTMWLTGRDSEEERGMWRTILETCGVFRPLAPRDVINDSIH